MVDFDNVYLRHRERRLLRIMRLKKKVTPKFDVSVLVSEYKLIVPNYSGKKNSIGEPLPDGTYSISDNGIRFLIFRRQSLFRRLVTPITVSVLTSVAVQLVTQCLWPLIKQLLG